MDMCLYVDFLGLLLLLVLLNSFDSNAESMISIAQDLLEAASMEYTTETGRLYLQRRTKRLLLSRNVFELSPRGLCLV